MARKDDAAEGGGEGSGVSQAPGSDSGASDVQALIRETVDQEVAGLKATNTNLKDEKRALAERVKTAEARLAELEARVAARDEQLASLVVDGEIRDAAAKAGLLPTATEDALYRGRQVFGLDSDGQAVAREGEGAVVYGSDGESPLTPAEWLESMREKAPHWWPLSTGSAAPGGAASGQESMLSYEQAGQLSPNHYARLRRDGRIT